MLPVEQCGGTEALGWEAAHRHCWKWWHLGCLHLCANVPLLQLPSGLEVNSGTQVARQRQAKLAQLSARVTSQRLQLVPALLHQSILPRLSLHPTILAGATAP